MQRTPDRQRRVAIFPWGGVVEDFLTPIGIDRHGFAMEMSGGWLFGYAEALRRHDVATTIVCMSQGVADPERHDNPRTNVATVFLPAFALYRLLRRWPGDTDDPVRPRIVRALNPLQDLARYAATRSGTVTRALRTEQVDVLLAQEYENPRFDRLVQIGISLGLPVWGSFQGAPPAQNLIERRIRRRAIAGAAGLIVASRDEANRVCRDYDIPEARVAPIPNPIDLDLWRPEDRAACRRALDLPGEAIIVVCHGRIDVHRKGIDVLLEAWRGLVSARPDLDLRLHLIGSGADDERLAAVLEQAPVSGLRWVRRYVTDRGEMRRELGAGDLYVLPSRHEGFPVAPLEAMACGLPIVAADAPGVPEILEAGEASGGLLVPRNDVGSLRAALERLVLSPADRASLAARARPRVTAFASLESVGKQLVSRLFESAPGSR